MICPNCGAENPDRAVYCGTCATLLQDETGSAGSTAHAPSTISPWRETPPVAERPVKKSTLSIASLSLVISLVFLSVGFALNVYYIEGWMINHGRDYSTIHTIIEAQYYSNQLGDLAAIVGLIFLVQVLITHPSRDALLAHALKERLILVKWMLVLAAVLVMFSLSIYFSVSRLKVEMDYGMFIRSSSYSTQVAWLLVAAALLTFTLSLRDTERSNL